MPITQAELALGVFTVCNTARVFAYVPQLVKIGRDRQGATAISYTTWALFGMSHFSTVAYAVLAVNDWRMAAVFAANTLCCVLILALTAWKRRQFRAAGGMAETPPVNIQRPSIFRILADSAANLLGDWERRARLRRAGGPATS